ncbi:MAG: DUF3881 family protein [Lachnospiraceae bacterium]|nr:DUF3881 family protein [Lachnospiraceae bacterium]
MHKFMTAIGFHDCYTKRQLDDIIKTVLSSPDAENVVTDGMNRKIFQVNKQFASRMGVSVVGEIDNRGFRNVLFAFPYLEGNYLTEEDEIQLQKFAEKDAYAGISENYNLGVSLIFYLLNLAPIIERKRLQQNIEYNKVYLSALSTEGKILFGIEKNESQLKKESEGQITRNTLIQEAKNGDMDAIESLTLEDIDLYSIISRRAMTEDIYSIVDTSFMPYGVESDQYSIIGHIQGIQKHRNKVTNELVYVLEVCCNDISITVGINSLNLLGEPEIGRRFKGNIWMQGILKIDDNFE